jgi:DNA modification methylase
MGKEKDGVENDNLYDDKLDAFQMQWWKAVRRYLKDNASAYIWGNAPDLWRLWYRGGLADSERMTLRNEITWDKREDNPTMLVSGVPLKSRRMYHPTERCLFFMLGEQGFNNNADNYWEGWDCVVNYLRTEKDKTGWDIATFKRLAGHSETSGCHWFDKSQWMFPTKPVYESWQRAAKGDAFKREHDDLKREHDELKQAFYSTRAHFDNTHDNMTDVWDFKRVTGEDRHGHATPKPVDMMARIMKSSCPSGGLVIEPFGGSGSTLIGAARTGRVCRTMEISPIYCDTIRRRWTKFAKDNNVEPGTGALE